MADPKELVEAEINPESEVINSNVVNLQNHPFPKIQLNLDTYFFRFNLLEPKEIKFRNRSIFND